jgi:hypothetical protein
MVNMAAIGDRDALEFAAFDVLPSDKDVEEYSKSEEFREIKKEIIDFLAIYSE